MKNTESKGFYLFQNLLLIVSKNYSVDNNQKLAYFQTGVKEFKDFVFLQDLIIDQDIDWLIYKEKKTNILTQTNTHYKNAIISLLKVFPEDHLFWQYLAEEEKYYYDYIAREKYYNITRPTLSIHDFEETSYAKHNLALVPIKGMSWLFKENIPYEEIKEIFVPIFNGMQMLDDIDDFGKDLKSGQWNLIQSEVNRIISDESLSNNENLDRFEERILYASGISEKYSVYALEQYKIAFTLAENFDFQELSHWLLQIIEEVKHSLEFIKKVNS